jgi:hypothetical protein
MQLRKLFLSSALIAAVAAPALAASPARGSGASPSPSAVSGSISVGDFLVRMAKVLDPKLPDGATAEEAVASLKESGVTVPGDMQAGRALTEGDVVRFASAAGLRLKTLDPNELFPAAKVDALGNLLGSQAGVDRGDPARSGDGSVLAGNDGQGPNPGDVGSPRAREKRKKKKVFESPTSTGG